MCTHCFTVRVCCGGSPTPSWSNSLVLKHLQAGLVRHQKAPCKLWGRPISKPNFKAIFGFGLCVCSFHFNGRSRKKLPFLLRQRAFLSAGLFTQVGNCFGLCRRSCYVANILEVVQRRKRIGRFYFFLTLNVNIEIGNFGCIFGFGLADISVTRVLKPSRCNFRAPACCAEVYSC